MSQEKYNLDFERITKLYKEKKENSKKIPGISLKDRNKMIELSIKESGYDSWLYNLNYGFGSHQVVQDVTLLIQKTFRGEKLEN